jgi:sRNA-binding regulator protein Hfq
MYYQQISCQEQMEKELSRNEIGVEVVFVNGKWFFGFIR